MQVLLLLLLMLFNAHAMDGQALWSRYKME